MQPPLALVSTQLPEKTQKVSQIYPISSCLPLLFTLNYTIATHIYLTSKNRKTVKLNIHQSAVES